MSVTSDEKIFSPIKTFPLEIIILVAVKVIEKMEIKYKKMEPHVFEFWRSEGGGEGSGVGGGDGCDYSHD